MIESTSENRSQGSIPPIHKAIIEYDDGSVMIYVHSGREGNTDDEDVLNVNITTIGGVKKFKGWKITDMHLQENGNLYVQLSKEPQAKSK